MFFGFVCLVLVWTCCLGVIRQNFVENWSFPGTWLGENVFFDFGGLCFDLVFCLRRFGLALGVVLNFVFWWDWCFLVCSLELGVGIGQNFFEI